MQRKHLVLTIALALPASLQAQENVMLVLDASGSMWGQIGGVTKIEIARETIAGLVNEWKPENPLGLVAYGHRVKGDCSDIETLIPVGPLDARAYIDTVNRLNPRGMTPLSAAVVQAAEALKYSEQKATVVLVSDGEETCNLDPCEVGASLQAAGVDFTAHVIGFDVVNPEHQAQLRCLAENTGGRYFNASDADDLAVALGSVVAISTEVALPPAEASLSAPEQATVVTDIEIAWEGPADPGDYIVFIAANDPRATELGYVWVRQTEKDVADPGAALSLRTPAKPGDYLLRYVSPRRKLAVLGEVKVQVVEAVVSISGPAEASAGTSIEVTAIGPVDSGHWIGFAPAGSPPSAYRHYVRPTAGTETYSLRTPGEPGEYELRYVLNESAAIAASQPIRINPAAASVSGPSEAMAGTSITVIATGPIQGGHWIGFAPAGSSPGTYRDYVRPSADSDSYQLRTPGEPGEYELRYVLNESGPVVASQPIRILAAEASVSGPTEAVAGSQVVINATGPVDAGHWIGFAPAGSPANIYRDYTRPKEGIISYSLTAPTAPGDYEIRYVLNESGPVVASQKIRILPAE